jgi:hypothetical protein
MSSTDPNSRIDPNDLAALLDGGLSPTAREEVLARLANDPQALASVADAAEILAELEQVDSGMNEVSTPSQGDAASVFVQRTAVARWFVGLAATLVLATLIAQLFLGQRAVDPDRLARILAGPGDLPALEVLPRLRSVKPVESRIEPSSDFFLGALSLRIVIGLEAGDTAMSSASARDIQTLLPSAVDLPQALQALYGDLADDLEGGMTPEAAGCRVRQAREEVLATLGASRRQGYDLGMMVEAVRLASSRDATDRLPRQVAGELERLSRTVAHPQLAEGLGGLALAINDGQDPRAFELAGEVEELCRRTVECLPSE